MVFMNKNKRNSKKVLAAICAFSGAFGGNSGASAALKNKKVPTVKTDVKSNVKSKNLSLNRQSGNKNFFGKAWDLIKANPVKSSLITAGGLTVAVGTPLLIAKLIKGKKDDKDPNKKNKKENKENKENKGDQKKLEDKEIKENQEKLEDKKIEEEIKEEIKENQEKLEDKKIEEEIKEEIKENQEKLENKGEIKIEIEEKNQPQQLEDNFKLHFDNLKVNDKEPDLTVNEVWNVLKSCKITTGNPNVKFYKIEKDRYAVMVRKSTSEEKQLLSFSAKDLKNNGEVLSDFKVLCIARTSDGILSGSSLKFVGPSDFLSFKGFSAKQNNLTVEKK